MGTTVKYTLLGNALGLLLASVGWLVWKVGAMVFWGDAWNLVALGPMLGVGFFSAGGAGLMTSLLLGSPSTESNDPPAKPLVPKKQKPKRKRRRHPFDRHLARARITSALRWQAITKPLAKLLHVERDEVVGQPIFERMHPEDVPAVDKALTQAKTAGKTQQVLCRFQIVDADAVPPMPKNNSMGSDTYILPALTPTSVVYVRLDIKAKRDRAAGFECRVIDLTEIALKKELEMQTARKELSRARKRQRSVDQDLARLKLSYRELYQHAPVMYFSMDGEGKLVTFNDTLIRMLGYERLELQGKQYTMLLAPATLKSYLTIAEAMPSQEGELETQWRKKDGTIIDIWVHSVPVYDDAGQFVRHRSAALDLTEKNRLANELRARGDELERTNQQLRTINSELEAFTHVVSHDLKEPLRTLQAYSHILAEEHSAQLGPDGFQYINHLIRASRRLGVLIDELLNLSQAGRITHAPKAFNLIEIVATVRQDLVDMIQRKEASVLTEGSLPDVVGDPLRITQLMTNLVANGLKYNQNPQPSVVIGAAPCADDPSRVTIWVRDNGIGIDPSFHTQIFAIFRRLHQTDQFEGTGAGLAICKKIVEGHGGRIWVESTLGHGATFYFTLPRYPTAAPPNANNGATPKAAGESPSKVRKAAVHAKRAGAQTPPHIVLVEDQSDVAMIIQMLARRDGLAITWFPTAEKAWEYLRKRGADLLLLDVNLPGISGDELCRRLRKLEHLKETPVAMFTPDYDPEKVEELRAAGADYFLTKDLLCQPTHWQRRMQELIAQIRQPAPH